MPALTKIIATFFGIGFIPLASGTWASAASAGICWYLSEPVLIASIVLLSALGLWACAPSRIVLRSEDPSAFVMDEVCGMMLSVLWMPKAVPVYVAAFFLFRLFDIWKPWPISRIQASPHPWSIMLDDLLAGIFTNIVLQVLIHTVWIQGA
jgi:phosphatidylglycerophosphatase A